MKEQSTAQQWTEQQLHQAVTGLETEITPARDLWPGIERAINLEPQTTEVKSSNITAWAASIAIAITASWYFLTPEQVVKDSPVSIVANMQQDFQQQKKVMMVNLGSPNIQALPADFQQELHKLASAQQMIIAALAADPDNSDLLNLLRWTQNQELDLLQKIYSPQWQTI